MSQLDLWKKSWDPFREYGFGPKGLDRFFDDALKLRGPGGGLSMAFNPGVEMREAKDSYMMKFDLPGLTKDQIKIDFYENTLTVSGDRKEEKTTEDKDAKVHYSEMSYGSFTRSFSFPQAVDVEKANAKFDNGVLTVEVPKRDGGNRRQIQVR
jgi:HSP20 family protein